MGPETAELMPKLPTKCGVPVRARPSTGTAEIDDGVKRDIARADAGSHDAARR
jgi:hypothetical protein